MDFPRPFLVYKSSAGSGKTFNLAKVYLTLILTSSDPNYFKRILAITFTVKAAAEMKDRIVSYLSILAGNTTRQRNDARHMLKALMDETELSQDEIRARSQSCLNLIMHQFGEFNIVTIDKFFARLVRAFASDLTLAPDFEILVDRNLLIDRATDLLFDRVGQDEDLTFLVLQMLKSRLSDDKSNNADDIIANACRSLLSDDFYFAKSNFKEWTPKAVYALKEELDQEAKRLKNLISEPATLAMKLLSNWSIDEKDLYYGKSGIYGYFKRISNGDFSKMAPGANVLKTIENDKWTSSTKNPAVDQIKDQLRTCYEQILALIQDSERLQLINALRAEIYTLGFYSELERILEWIREEDNVRLLSEFNSLISDQLHDEQTFFLFERLGTQFNHILIDEFQDTSVLQWNNLLPLVENSLSEGNTSLIVGDAKQSIYRWRNSDPEQFVKLPKVNHPSSGLLESLYKEVILDKNYRSAKQVVEFNNRFFDLAKTHILSDAYSPTYETLHQEHTSEIDGSVQWWIGDDPKQTKEALLLTMLDRIRIMMDTDGIAPGDICTLFRTNSDAASFASMLLESGFDVISQESLLLKNNPQVKLILSSLDGLQRNQDPYIVQLWLSQLHQHRAFPDPHLLAKKAKKERWTFMQTASHLGIDLSVPVVQHGDNFQRSFAICTLLNIPTDNAFVSKFLDYCLRFEMTGGYLKENFLEFWMKKADTASIQLTPTSDAVNVMTIHKSKGLEFPVVAVFMPDVSLSRKTKEYAWIDVQEPWEIGNIQLKVTDLNDSSYRHLLEDEVQRSSLDVLNVLYVAFTRAEQRLEVFSSGPTKNSLLNALFAWPEWDEQNRVLRI
ncbi:MAG: UvrD-helicase domain-containing protein [Cryomorphaceae bacterium]